jgi:hypothetical protein
VQEIWLGRRRVDRFERRVSSATLYSPLIFTAMDHIDMQQLKTGEVNLGVRGQSVPEP